jgi:hypothetical protein
MEEDGHEEAGIQIARNGAFSVVKVDEDDTSTPLPDSPVAVPSFLGGIDFNDYLYLPENLREIGADRYPYLMPSSQRRRTLGDYSQE